MLVAVVGVCASGKTTLVSRLRSLGIDAYHPAQEHSCVKKLWNRRQPDILVMLDATLPVICRRRNVYWGQERLDMQHERLADAREHADLLIQTDCLSKDDVAQTVLDYIQGDTQHGTNYSDGSETRS